VYEVLAKLAIYAEWAKRAELLEISVAQKQVEPSEQKRRSEQRKKDAYCGSASTEHQHPGQRKTGNQRAPWCSTSFLHLMAESMEPRMTRILCTGARPNASGPQNDGRPVIGV